MLNPPRVIVLRFIAVLTALVLIAVGVQLIGSALGVPSSLLSVVGFAIGFVGVVLTQVWWLYE